MGLEVFQSKTLATMLISVIGITDLIGRLLGGYIADLRLFPVNILMAISVGVPGLVALLMGLFQKSYFVWLTAVLLGSMAGSYIALIAPSVVELFGLAKVGAGFGIVAFFMGALMVPVPVIFSKYMKYFAELL